VTCDIGRGHEPAPADLLGFQPASVDDRSNAARVEAELCGRVVDAEKLQIHALMVPKAAGLP
jgi:hypothetical protein